MRKEKIGQRKELKRRTIEVDTVAYFLRRRITEGSAAVELFRNALPARKEFA